MSEPVSAFLVIGGLFKVASSIAAGSQQKELNAVKETEALYNAKQYRYDKVLAHWEEAMAVDQQLSKGRKDIATGYGSMAARGNIGSSAQSQVFGSTLNLMKDISAIQYKYDNEAIQHENQARVQEFNAKYYRKNRGNAMLGTFLNVGGNVMSTAAAGSNYGIW